MTDVTRTRFAALLVAAAIVLALLGASRPRVVGDGGEYIAMALNFASFHGPAINAAQVPDIEATIASIDDRFSDSWIVRDAVAQGPQNTDRYDFVHFWFYSFLAAPAVRAAETVGLSPLVGFTVTNLLLLGLALWIAVPRMGAAASALLFASPIVWWIDKAHTEAFTFALLVMALALAEDRPSWAMVAAAVASTQNPPIAVIVVLVFVFAVIRRLTVLKDARFLAGAAVAAVLVLLGPTYTYLHHQTVSLLLSATRPGTPPWAEVLTPLLDPDVGLLGNDAVWFVVWIGAVLFLLVRRPSRLVSPGVLTAAMAFGIFLFSFAHNVNFHHGATPSMSRYGLWLVALTAPLLIEAHANGGGGWRAFVVLAAGTSAVISAFAFHPALAENANDPTWAARFVWGQHPRWDNPLPEVFGESIEHNESIVLPVATDGCEKLLAPATPTGVVSWPIPCAPDHVPDVCRSDSRVCYANLGPDHHYTFRLAPGRTTGAWRMNPAWAWPPQSLDTIRRLYDEWNWWNLPKRAAGLEEIRQVQGAHATVFGDAADFVLVLDDIKEGAPAIYFRLRAHTSGVLVDPATGQTLDSPHFDGSPGEPWTLALPSDHGRLLLLRMKRD